MALGFVKRPQRMIMISYHHHSKQTETQLGAASFRSGVQPVRHSRVGGVHVGAKIREIKM